MGTNEEVCHKCDSFIIMTYFGNEWTELSLAVFISPALMNFWLLMLHKENLGNRFVSANLKYQQKCTCSKSHEISWQKKKTQKNILSAIYGAEKSRLSLYLSGDLRHFYLSTNFSQCPKVGPGAPSCTTAILQYM